MKTRTCKLTNIGVPRNGMRCDEEAIVPIQVPGVRRVEYVCERHARELILLAMAANRLAEERHNA